ncbi:MAG: AMP-binding protein [Acidimicrobiia bacterium]|nr:AMP-binding protein [Acidimicrobiia bacterium]
MSRNLVAILGTRATTAGAVERAWDDGDAVVVLDPGAPPAVIRSRLDALAPTHIVDDNRHRRADGIPVDDDVAAVVMTSGTSSVPRAVTLTWEGMRAMARGVSSALDTGNGDTWLCCLPLHHVAGLAVLARHRLNDEGLVLHENFDIDAVSQAPAMSVRRSCRSFRQCSSGFSTRAHPSTDTASCSWGAQRYRPACASVPTRLAGMWSRAMA